MSAHTPEEIHAELAAAFNARDLEAFADLYEPDAALIVPPDGQRVQGREAIQVAVRPTFEMRPRFTSEVAGKLERDDIALTVMRWSAIGEGDGGVEMSGWGAVVSRRGADGSWRIVLDNPLGPDAGTG